MYSYTAASCALAQGSSTHNEAVWISKSSDFIQLIFHKISLAKIYSIDVIGHFLMIFSPENSKLGVQAGGSLPLFISPTNIVTYSHSK